MSMQVKQMTKTKQKVLDAAAALDYYNRGFSDKDIADNCGVCRETIAKWRRSNGFPANHPQPVKKQRKLSPLVMDAIAAREAGMTYGQYKAQQFKAANPWKGGRR